MMQGRLIVMEGIDGSGKSTQYRRLCQRFADEGIAFKRILFPRYDMESSALIRMYLSGDFGANPAQVSPYIASTFFAGDRYASYMTDWKTDYLAGGLILSDRYTTSNVIHQGAKLPPSELRAYLDWLYDYEFRLMELPRPDLVLYMDVDLETALTQLRARQAATGTRGDIHENSLTYMERCHDAGALAADYLGWKRIACVRDGRMRDVEDIHGEIRGIIKGSLGL